MTQVRKMRWRLIVLGCILILATLAFSWYLNDQVARHEFDHLLRGDNDVAIKEVHFSGQGRQGTLDDPVSVAYLSRMLRQAKHKKSGSGLTFSAYFTLADGRHLSCWLYLPETKKDLTLNFSMSSFDEEGTLFFVELREPVPEPLANLIDQVSPRIQP